MDQGENAHNSPKTAEKLLFDEKSMGNDSLDRRVRVLMPLPFEAVYDYLVPKGMVCQRGDYVTVPLGTRQVYGIVWGPGEDKTLDPRKLKSIVECHDCPPAPDCLLKFIDWVASYTLNSPGNVMRMVLRIPAALDPPRPMLVCVPTGVEPSRLTDARRRVLAVARDGFARGKADLAREAGTSTSVINGLIDAGVLRLVEARTDPLFADPDPDGNPPILSQAQEAAAGELRKAVADQSFSCHLIDGVTGSGKTEVYFEAVAEALRHDKQAVILVPEIALTVQFLRRFEERFGVTAAHWHSELSPPERRKTWRAVVEGQAKVVIGARSALFLPFPDLGVIIVDEEHEPAFKQEDGTIYHARDMAIVRASLTGIPVVLASATPSLETLANCESGRYVQHHLPERHGSAVMPEVQAVNMLEAPPERGRWLSQPLIEALKKTFEAGEQAMLFLNRRGYAPLTLCRTCGHRFQCPNCSTWLVEHRFHKKLQCHHCGFHQPVPHECPECHKEDSLTPCGPGVERLAEEVQELFPELRLAIMSSDNLHGPSAMAELVGMVERHEIDLLIGTQMMAKGHHFPMLTLVGVVDGDLGLSGGDLRASERTFQILHQVAGRAGRGERPGKVLIQTYMAHHPVMAALVSGDKDRFMEQEKESRLRDLMPPFGRLTALILSGPDLMQLQSVARELAKRAPYGEGILALGPAPAPLALLRGRHRLRFLLKVRKDIHIQTVLHQWIDDVRIPNNVRLSVDVDPYSFL